MNRKEHKGLGGIYRDRFKDHESELNAEAWEKIASKLPPDKTTFEYYKQSIISFRFLLGIVVGGIITASLFILNNNNTTIVNTKGLHEQGGTGTIAMNENYQEENLNNFKSSNDKDDDQGLIINSGKSSDKVVNDHVTSITSNKISDKNLNSSDKVRLSDEINSTPSVDSNKINNKNAIDDQDNHNLYDGKKDQSQSKDIILKEKNRKVLNSSRNSTELTRTSSNLSTDKNKNKLISESLTNKNQINSSVDDKNVIKGNNDLRLNQNSSENRNGQLDSENNSNNKNKANDGGEISDNTVISNGSTVNSSVTENNNNLMSGSKLDKNVSSEHQLKNNSKMEVNNNAPITSLGNELPLNSSVSENNNNFIKDSKLDKVGNSDNNIQNNSNIEVNNNSSDISLAQNQVNLENNADHKAFFKEKKINKDSIVANTNLSGNKNESTSNNNSLDAASNIADKSEKVKKQETKSTGKLDASPKSRFILGYNLSPESSFRKLSANSNYRRVVEVRNNNEKAKIGFSTAITIQYKLTERILIGTGISLMNVGEKGKYTDSTNGSLKDYSNNYTYMGIPVLVGYKIGNKKFGTTINSGIIFNKLLNAESSNQGDSYYNDDDYGQNNNNNGNDENLRPQYSDFNMVYIGNIEFNYHIYNRLSLCVGPTFKYFLTSIYQHDENLISKPYSIGLQVGLKFHF